MQASTAHDALDKCKQAVCSGPAYYRLHRAVAGATALAAGGSAMRRQLGEDAKGAIAAAVCTEFGLEYLQGADGAAFADGLAAFYDAPRADQREWVPRPVGLGCLRELAEGLVGGSAKRRRRDPVVLGARARDEVEQRGLCAHIRSGDFGRLQSAIDKKPLLLAGVGWEYKGGDRVPLRPVALALLLCEGISPCAAFLVARHCKRRGPASPLRAGVHWLLAMPPAERRDLALLLVDSGKLHKEHEMLLSDYHCGTVFKRALLHEARAVGGGGVTAEEFGKTCARHRANPTHEGWLSLRTPYRGAPSAGEGAAAPTVLHKMLRDSVSSAALKHLLFYQEGQRFVVDEVASPNRAIDLLVAVDALYGVLRDRVPLLTGAGAGAHLARIFAAQDNLLVVAKAAYCSCFGHHIPQQKAWTHFLGLGFWERCGEGDDAPPSKHLLQRVAPLLFGEAALLPAAAQTWSLCGAKGVDPAFLLGGVGVATLRSALFPQHPEGERCAREARHFATDTAKHVLEDPATQTAVTLLEFTLENWHPTASGAPGDPERCAVS